MLGGATASVPGQRAPAVRPSYDADLVGAADSLLSVDLDSGDITTVTSTYSGTPCGPCASARAFRRVVGRPRCGRDPVRVAGPLMEDNLGGNATSLAFRVNRGKIVLNDANSG